MIVVSMMRRRVGGHHQFQHMCQLEWACEGVIIQANKGAALFNYQFEKSMYVAVIIVIMVLTTIAYYEMDKSDIIGIDLTIRESIEIYYQVLILLDLLINSNNFIIHVYFKLYWILSSIYKSSYFNKRYWCFCLLFDTKVKFEKGWIREKEWMSKMMARSSIHPLICLMLYEIMDGNHYSLLYLV